jgi:hypothetical protein
VQRYSEPRQLGPELVPVIAYPTCLTWELVDTTDHQLERQAELDKMMIVKE